VPSPWRAILTTTQLDDPDGSTSTVGCVISCWSALGGCTVNRNGWVQAVVIWATSRSDERQVVFVHGEELVGWLRENS
jgi:hypothetical protein